MDKRRRDRFIPSRSKHRARACHGDARGDSANNGPTDSKIVSIGDFEAFRDALLDAPGPRGYRVATARLSKRPTVVSIGTSPDAATDSEDEPDLDVRNEGTIIVFTPLTEAGKHFLHEVL